jgi:hypothetical protein
MRNVAVYLLAGGLALSMLSSVAVAQVAGTGAVAGRVVFCRSLPRFSEDFAPDSPAKPQRPAANVEVSIAATSLRARTDATGHFVILGVPAAERLTLQAELVGARPLLMLWPNLIVDAGQTIDVGTLELSDCLRTLLPVGGDFEPAEQRVEPILPAEFELAPEELQPVPAEMEPELVDGGAE